MGLGTVSENGGGLFLSIAGGYIWNRKADESDPNYAEQEYVKADKSTGTRKGARYADLTGLVVDVQFRTHAEYGDSINVTFEADGDKYIISSQLDNRNAGDLMKALLVADLNKPLYVKPYDFVDKSKKRSAGVSTRQDGEKLDLRQVVLPSDLQKDSAWFSTASKRELKRFFEDVTDHIVNRVKTEICPQFEGDRKNNEASQAADPLGDGSPKKETTPKPSLPKADASKAEVPKVTPLKMKKAIQDYIKENYPDESMPELTKDQLVEWYELTQRMEELPFEEEDNIADGADDEADDLNDQLDAILGKK